MSKNQEIKDAMIARMLAVWPNTTIYQETVPQGFDEPSFCVLSAGTSHEGDRRLRAWRVYAYVVHYFAPESADMRTECEEIGERLIDTLEYIDGNPTKLRRGHDVRYDVSDQGVLTLHISYRVMLARDPGDIPKMEDLTHQEVVNDGSKKEKPGCGEGGVCDGCTALFCVTIDAGGEIRGGDSDTGGA